MVDRPASGVELLGGRVMLLKPEAVIPARVMAPTSDVLYDFIGKAVCGMDLF